MADLLSKDVRQSRLWNRLLERATPTGWILPKGTPQRMVAELAADSALKDRLIPPVLSPSDLLPASILQELREYARSARSSAYEALGHQVSDGAEAIPCIDKSGILQWCRENAPVEFSESIKMCFIYYREGQLCRLHFDDDEAWEFNFLLCLERKRPENGKATSTYFFEGNEKLRSYDLSPGQAVWFHSRCTPHGRTPLGQGEEVVLASLGMRSV
ncbi:hypothetical protein ABZY10_34745 [Streptomyces sp. NPDC006539]|uniref:hypothetical protein n=1 Tax=Streptomyces sp. NPDC006539 TaxID=3155352 RepID=UPI0033AEEC97